MSESADETRIFLSTLRPGRRERQLALGAVAVSVIVFAVLAPFAKWSLPMVWAFVPIYQSALAVCDLLTAALFIGQYHILFSRPLLILAGGYLLSACMAIAHTLSFPGLFSPTGLLGSGPQTTAWLYMMWHGAFPLAVIAYARARPIAECVRPASPWRNAAICIALAVSLSCLMTAIATVGHPWLPPLMRGSHEAGWIRPVVSIVWLLNFVALAILIARRARTILDLWLIVVLCAWVFDIALSAVLNHARFDLGFYAGRIYGLIASSFVLVAMTFDNIQLYARVVQALGRERAERQLVQHRTMELNEAKALLEQRVQARTAALAESNRDLLREVTERQRTQAALVLSQKELREVAAMSSSAREQEMRRISRELHDELAQTLATLRIETDWLREATAGAPEDAATRSRLAAMRALLDEAVASTRRIASDLRPLVLDDLGLVAAVQWLVQNFTQRTGVPCNLTLDPPDIELTEPYATATFRILQESLTNVARHAHATHVEVGVARAHDRVVLTIRDDGVGFDPARPRKAASFGLAGLRERAYLVDGELRIDSAPGRGTTIEVRIPLQAAQERELS
ncbi:sensor histidine kinase [Trinickia dabaoshanensis]|uniref:histidine kinase n=1 Tax=Trinickia dabaoshanensis TaxID=564714 RepID=A0A2N7VE60_9BURK|nr:sensor histidine kinase [Trinickia dabaoshanensis]PMS15425.1 sensor histidine kinase [Trinickia dabaoshanensis]